MKDKMLVRIVLVILGSAVMGLSINLLVAAGFGLDPLSLFQAGLCNVFHISLGQASQLLMTGIIIILFFLDRKRIGIGSILNSILVGAFVNFFAAGFPAGAHVPLWGRLLSAAGGFLFMGMGIGIYISARLGEAGIDAMMMYFMDKYRYSAAFGFILGGCLGWATLISMAVNGVIIQATVQIMKQLIRINYKGVE